MHGNGFRRIEKVLRSNPIDESLLNFIITVIENILDEVFKKMMMMKKNYTIC